MLKRLSSKIYDHFMVKKMKKLWLELKRSMPLTLMLLTLTALLPRPAHAVITSPAGTIFLSPSSISWTTITNKVNDTLTLEVRVTNVTECYLIVFSAQWNDNVIQLTNVVQGNVLEPGTSFLVATLPPSAGGDPGNPNNILGGVTYTKLGPTAHGVTIQPPSDGLVATLTFKAVLNPPAGFPLSTSIFFLDTVDYPTRWVTSPASDPLIIEPFAEFEWATKRSGSFRFEGIYTTTTEIIADGQTFYVAVQSNSSITTPVFTKTITDGGSLTFNVTGASGTAGFSKVTIPKTLMWVNGENWLITVDMVDVTSACTITENATHTFIDIPYTHSPSTIEIISPYAIPEFPAAALLPIFIAIVLLTTLLSVKFTARKRRTAAT